MTHQIPVFLFSTIILLLVPCALSAQDLSFLTSDGAHKTSISMEHAQMQALDEQRAAFSVPVYKSDDSQWSLIARGQRTALEESLTFAESGIRIPEEFGTADFGVGWSQEDLRGSKVGVSATYGNAGTRLFSGESNPVVNANLIIERKKLDHSWFYFLSYSNNRTTLNGIPLPGIAYGLNGKTYTAFFGVPFVFVMWRPDPFSVSAGLSPFGASLDSSFRVWGPLQMFANGNWSPRSYQNLVKGSDNRLIFDKKEAGGGLRLMLGRMGNLSVGYFHGFDRRFLLGESITDDDVESIAIEDAAGVQVKMRLAL